MHMTAEAARVVPASNHVEASTARLDAATSCAVPRTASMSSTVAIVDTEIARTEASTASIAYVQGLTEALNTYP